MTLNYETQRGQKSIEKIATRLARSRDMICELELWT